MIRADELKQNRSKHTDVALKEIEQSILKAEAQGDRFIRFNLSKQVDPIHITDALIDAGYSVMRHNGTDIRGGTWDYIYVSWE